MKPLLELYRRELQDRAQGVAAEKTSLLPGWATGIDATQTERDQHLLWMLDEMDTMNASPPNVEALAKLHRWLGFVQGVMWTTGIYSIDELRAHTRQAKGG